MGKGDINTKRGKISKGTFGVTRRVKDNKKSVAAVPEEPIKADKKAPVKKKTPAKKKAE